MANKMVAQRLDSLQDVTNLIDFANIIDFLGIEISKNMHDCNFAHDSYSKDMPIVDMHTNEAISHINAMRNAFFHKSF